MGEVSHEIQQILEGTIFAPWHRFQWRVPRVLFYFGKCKKESKSGSNDLLSLLIVLGHIQPSLGLHCRLLRQRVALDAAVLVVAERAAGETSSGSGLARRGNRAAGARAREFLALAWQAGSKRRFVVSRWVGRIGHTL